MSTGLQLLLNGLVAGTSYALFATSFSLIYSTARFFNFAHGVVYTTAAYVFLFLLTSTNLSTPLVVALALVGCAMLGGLTEICVYRPLRNRGSTAVVLLLSSLGLLVALQNCISLFFGDEIRSIPGSNLQATVQIDGASITVAQLTIVLTCLGLWLATWLGLRYTRIGRMFRAVANDVELASVVGIDSNKVILMAFLVGSLLVGANGVVVGYDTGLRPTMGFNALLMGVVAFVVGGAGSIPGALLGGLFIGVVQQFGVWKLPTQWQDAIVFAILLIFLLIRPQGFLGKPLRKAEI